MRQIILASSSPNRFLLMKQIFGDKFKCEAGTYEEDNTLPLPPKQLALKHSRGKARSVAKNYKNALIIGSDTFVWYQDVCGKPHNLENARQMLRKISGKTVQVISGLTVIDTKSGKEFSGVESTDLKMKKLSKSEIESYITKEDVTQNAGAFKIQGLGVLLVENNCGCYTNVVGLPLPLLHKLLIKAGLRII